MEQYESNSHLSKDKKSQELSEVKQEKVVTGKVKQRKKTEFQKSMSNFIQEDVQNVKSYIFLDVIIPTLKRTISDIVTNGIDLLLYGETKSRSNNRYNTPASTVSYRSYYDARREDERRPRYSTNIYECDEIILETERDAREVLSRLDEILERYGVVRVADYYDLVGVQCRYTDNKYGWMDLRSADILRTRDGGYFIKLPKAINID